ncbi:MAG TPA: nucleotidyltransferase domain-containing protein [Promineifilum sp.]|nr:nucleotidyltransferase domain-containing protein [Promineifilum sp.]
MSRIIELDALLPVWKNAPDVVAAWAFGSAQDGQVRPGSDLDIGVLMARPPTFDEQLDLLGRLQDTLGLDEVDLVILNDANPILRFEAVSGRRLFTRDLLALAEFVSLTAREYEDEMAQYERALSQRGAV